MPPRKGKNKKEILGTDFHAQEEESHIHKGGRRAAKKSQVPNSNSSAATTESNKVQQVKKRRKKGKRRGDSSSSDEEDVQYTEHHANKAYFFTEKEQKNPLSTVENSDKKQEEKRVFRRRKKGNLSSDNEEFTLLGKKDKEGINCNLIAFDNKQQYKEEPFGLAVNNIESKIDESLNYNRKLKKKRNRKGKNRLDYSSSEDDLTTSTHPEVMVGLALNLEEKNTSFVPPFLSDKRKSDIYINKEDEEFSSLTRRNNLPTVNFSASGADERKELFLVTDAKKKKGTRKGKELFLDEEYFELPVDNRKEDHSSALVKGGNRRLLKENKNSRTETRKEETTFDKAPFLQENVKRPTSTQVEVEGRMEFGFEGNTSENTTENLVSSTVEVRSSSQLPGNIFEQSVTKAKNSEICEAMLIEEFPYKTYVESNLPDKFSKLTFEEQPRALKNRSIISEDLDVPFFLKNGKLESNRLRKKERKGRRLKNKTTGQEFGSVKSDQEEDILDALNKASGIELGSQFVVSQAVSRGHSTQSDDIVKIMDFNISVGGRELFKNASLVINNGQRYGLLGPNGRGKTTLLKHIASRALVGIPENITVLLVGINTIHLAALRSPLNPLLLPKVQQELEAPSEESVVAAVMKADRRTKLLLEEEVKLNRALDIEEDLCKQESLSARLQTVYELLHQRSAASAEGKVRSILYGLGFQTNAQDRPTRSFSGGWRMRIALAQALFMEPGLLLLDEPTNHLDLDAVIWLEDYLQKWKKMLLVVSHDQDFLDSVCTDCLHLDAKKLNHYKGGYYEFKKLYEQHFEQEFKKWKQQQKQLKQLKHSGLTAKKALEKTQKQQKAKDEKLLGKKARVLSMASLRHFF
ncbi:hypothetical protein Zmor_022071, partial [Zophobas morio]